MGEERELKSVYKKNSGLHSVCDVDFSLFPYISLLPRIDDMLDKFDTKTFQKLHGSSGPQPNITQSDGQN